jgi:hypothetical protein
MEITNTMLDGLNACYNEILRLTPQANQVMARLEMAENLRNEYARARFVTVTNVLAPEAFTSLVTSLLPILSAIAEQVSMPHTPSSNQTLSDGFRFSRVDPDCARHAATREKLTRLLKALGIVDFASLLASQLTPLVRYIAGAIIFRRVYFYIYAEGDYISVHNDHQVGDRVDVQFPITLGTVAGVRVLADGYLQMHYDRAGSMNVLGPCTWHDVPPVLRGLSGVDPVRFNMGFRFTSDG